MDDLLIDEDLDIEIEHALIAQDPDRSAEDVYTGRNEDVWGDWVPSADDYDTVERYKRAYRHFKALEADINARTDAEIERVEEWRRKHLPTGALAYLTWRLRTFSEKTGRQKHSSPAGTISWTKGRLRVVFADEAAFCLQNKGTPFVREKLEVAKDEIQKHVKAGGEIPDGADVERGPDTFHIKV